MASKRRMRRRGCDSKVKHLSRRSAKLAMKGTKPDGRTNVYRCPKCGLWHWGHTPGQGPRA